LALNRVQKIEGLDNNELLAELWLNNNKVSEEESIVYLSNVKALHTIYINGNPICKTSHDLEDMLRKVIPGLKEVDGNILKPKV